MTEATFHLLLGATVVSGSGLSLRGHTPHPGIGGGAQSRQAVRGRTLHGGLGGGPGLVGGEHRGGLIAIATGHGGGASLSMVGWGC